MFLPSQNQKSRAYKSLVKLPGFLLFSLYVLSIIPMFSDIVKADSVTQKPSLMLLKNYQANQDVSGWVMSEKLDGVRAYWNGENLVSYGIFKF